MLSINFTTIAMSSILEKLAHNTTDCIIPWGSWLYWCTPNQACAKLSFCYIRVLQIRHMW